MSTILKALRRLEQERAKGAERPLREQVVLARPRRRGGPWATGLAAAGALVLGFVATWAVLTGRGEPGEPAAPAAVSAAPPATGGTAGTAPAAPAAPPAATPRPLAAAPSALAPTTTSTSAPPLGAQASAPTPLSAAAPMPAPTPAPAPRVAVAAVPPPRPAPPLRAYRPDPTPEDVESADPGARTFADEDPILARPITGRAPRFVDDDEEPARRAAADVPVRVVRTHWHPQRDRRAAWVALGSESPREVHEGEWIGAYEIRSIEPDGVLFADGPLLVHEPVGAR